MNTYTFDTLNDKEFELLCSDLLGLKFNKTFERFKPGKDKGIDGRYLGADGKMEIIQCKHWVKTSLDSLVKALAKEEKPKVDKLKPARYFFCTSKEFDPDSKDEITRAFDGHIKSRDDVFGREDLNQLLNQYPDVEKRFFKLWLQSTVVLTHILNSAIYGRSDDTLNRVAAQSATYVVTSDHEEARKKLENEGVLIISGDPGIGKTTLANSLALEYAGNGFQYVQIAEDIREAEDVFDKSRKQLFYFDDFLGRNYLDALRGHEGNAIERFVRRIASDKNKRFILTSRSTVLSQGMILIDSLENANLNENSYELRITDLKDLDKARILYNHIWHSTLDPAFTDEIYKNKRYREIIEHENFNPRLISFITDPGRLKGMNSDTYWTHIETSLNNPGLIWKHPFEAQLDNAGRAIVLLIVFNGRGLDEVDLSKIYHRLVSGHGGQQWLGNMDLHATLRMLTGSFLTRLISKDEIVFDLFNPSIGDFVLERYAADVATLTQIFTSLNTSESVNTLVSLRRFGARSAKTVGEVATKLLQDHATEGFSNLKPPYVVSLAMMVLEYSPEPDSRAFDSLTKAANYTLRHGKSLREINSVKFTHWALRNKIVQPDDAITFVAKSWNTIVDADDFDAISVLLKDLPDGTSRLSWVLDAFYEHVMDLLNDDLESYIDMYEALSDVAEGDYSTAAEKISEAITDSLSDFGLDYSHQQAAKILESYNFRAALDKIYESYDGVEYRHEDFAQTIQEVDEIDDLFDRSV